MTQPENLVWWHSDQGVVPTAATRPWTFDGASTPTLNTEPTGVRIQDVGGVIEVFKRPWFPFDNARTPARYADSIWFQIQITGASATSGWGSGASPIGFWVDDGKRALGVSVGSLLQLINPYTGVVIATASGPFPWLTTQTLTLWKSAADRWVVTVDGVVLLSIAYAGAPSSSVGAPATYGFGSMSAAGVSDATYEQAEVGVNRTIPPQWKVDRGIVAMPVPLQARWTGVARAALRTTLGMIEAPLQALTDALNALTAMRLDQYTFLLTGRRLPSAEIPAWTDLTGANLSVLHERLRLTHDGLTVTGALATFPAGTLPPLIVEYTARAEFTVRSFTVDAQARVGPHIVIHTGIRQVTAQLVQPATDQSAWVLTDAALVGAFTDVGIRWPVDALQRTRVEVQVLGEDWVLLLINDTIIDRKPYASFPASATTPRVQIACQGQAAPVGPTCIVDVEDSYAVRRLSDLTRRAPFLQNAVERLIFVGGCERNDELDTWMRHHQQVEGFRGTTQGITIEMRRLSCNEDTVVVTTVDFGDWYLERSYPEVTPIWLEFNGTLTDVVVEFGIGSINFTPQQLADLAAQYLVPTSVTELEYFICFAAITTGNSIVPAPGTTRYAVKSTEGFEVGDTVTVRNTVNTILEDHTVTAILSATSMETDETTFSPFPTASTLRKLLATT